MLDQREMVKMTRHSLSETHRNSLCFYNEQCFCWLTLYVLWWIMFCCVRFVMDDCLHDLNYGCQDCLEDVIHVGNCLNEYMFVYRWIFYANWIDASDCNFLSELSPNCHRNSVTVWSMVLVGKNKHRILGAIWHRNAIEFRW